MRAPRTRRRPHGFTLIEVVVSLGVMTVGAMAIMAMLSQVVRANAYARQLNIAMNIAQTWAERLKADAHTWTMGVDPLTLTPTAATVLSTTVFLRNVTDAPTVNFIQLPAVTSPGSRAFDYVGNELAIPAAVGAAAPFFCVDYRLNWVHYGNSIRADVRVFWPRDNANANMAADWPDCGGDPARLSPGGTLGGRYHTFYLPVVVGVTQVPR